MLWIMVLVVQNTAVLHPPHICSTAVALVLLLADGSDARESMPQVQGPGWARAQEEPSSRVEGTFGL